MGVELKQRRIKLGEGVPVSDEGDEKKCESQPA